MYLNFEFVCLCSPFPCTFCPWPEHHRPGGRTSGLMTTETSCLLLLLASALGLASSLTPLHLWGFLPDQGPRSGTGGDPNTRTLRPTPVNLATGLLDHRKAPRRIIPGSSSSSLKAPTGSQGAETGATSTSTLWETRGLDLTEGKRKQSCGVCVCVPKLPFERYQLIHCFENVYRRKYSSFLHSLKAMAG